MNVADFLLSVVSVAPSALIDYAVIALLLKLPLRLDLGWALRLLPAPVVLMAMMHTWQKPIEISLLICLGCVLAARVLQAAALWLGGLEFGRLRLGQPRQDQPRLGRPRIAGA
jgi:hypothetical protein